MEIGSRELNKIAFSMRNIGQAIQGFVRNNPRLTSALVGAAGIGLGGLGVDAIITEANKDKIARAIVDYAIISNPMYRQMTEAQKEEAAERLEEGFDTDPVLYAQAVKIYKSLKQQGMFNI
jgi:hypothetical protein